MSLFELNRPHKTSKLDRFQSKIQFASFFYFIKNAPKSTVFKLLHFGAGFFNLKTDSTDFGDFGDFQPKIQFATFFLLHKKCSKIFFFFFFDLLHFGTAFFKKLKMLKTKPKETKKFRLQFIKYSLHVCLFFYWSKMQMKHIWVDFPGVECHFLVGKSFIYYWPPPKREQ